jgi:hypothetical protein
MPSQMQRSLDREGGGASTANITEAGLNDDFDRLCPKPGKPMKNSLEAVLLRMVA